MSCPNCAKINAQLQAQSCCSGKNAKPKKSHDILILCVSLASLIVGFFLARNAVHLPAFPLTDPSWIAVFLCGFPIFRAAWNALYKNKKITSSLLISVAILAAIALQLFVFFGNAAPDGHAHDSYIFAAGEISFLMALGEAIELRTIRKSREGIEALIKLAPKQAFRKNGSAVESVPVEQLVRGDCVIVRPNDMIPADGIIIEGTSAVNQANLTGESVPADKCVGDKVLAGTWNQSGALTIRVEKPNADNTLSRLIKLVREAESKKAPIQHVADRWASYVVPAAILCSVLVALFAHFILDTDVLTSLVRGVTILVVFCPCAFALATPTAIAAGIGNASRHGILIKSGTALEALTSIDTVVFDKTGTLTHSALKIEAFFSAGTRSEKELLALCAAAEQHSQHPIAHAIQSAAHGLSLPRARNLSAKNGIGITCDIGDEEILICSFAALEKERISVSDDAAGFVKARRDLGETLVCVVADSTLEGIFSLSDTLRDGVPAMLNALRKEKISSIMLTGDNAAAAQKTAALAGVDDVFSELLPENKSEKVTALRQSGKKVLMVGDGVNDAPALATANCSIAMGALGSEIAVETADIAILNDNPACIPGLLKYSKTVLKTIHINFGLSLVINFSSVVLSAVGILDPVSGAIVHNASSVLVVTHSALLLFRKPD